LFVLLIADNDCPLCAGALSIVNLEYRRAGAKRFVACILYCVRRYAASQNYCKSNQFVVEVNFAAPSTYNH
jgi:hypothetical protein